MLFSSCAVFPSLPHVHACSNPLWIPSFRKKVGTLHPRTRGCCAIFSLSHDDILIQSLLTSNFQKWNQQAIPPTVTLEGCKVAFNCYLTSMPAAFARAPLDKANVPAPRRRFERHIVDKSKMVAPTVQNTRKDIVCGGA